LKSQNYPPKLVAPLRALAANGAPEPPKEDVGNVGALGTLGILDAQPTDHMTFSVENSVPKWRSRCAPAQGEFCRDKTALSPQKQQLSNIAART
jgi:hypothetical protein